MRITALLAPIALLLATAAPLSSVAQSPSDPAAWWANPERRVPERFDPLGDRRWTRQDRVVRGERMPDAGLYRLWGLVPLQTQVVRPGDMVVEAWVRPTGGRPEVIVRVTVRSDGTVWIQGRAGFACCRPDIQRRVDVDEELSRSTRDSFRALANEPLWRQPEHVLVRESADTITSLCVDGISYDLYLATQGRALHRRRSCDDAEIGSAAAVLTALLGAVRDRDPRIAAALPRNGNFERERAYFAEFLARGGQLEVDNSAPVEPPRPPSAAEPEVSPPTAAPEAAPLSPPTDTATVPQPTAPPTPTPQADQPNPPPPST